MQLILDMTGRKRPIISLPFGLGILQGAILEKLPVNLFTVTQAQVRFPKNIPTYGCAPIRIFRLNN